MYPAFPHSMGADLEDVPETPTKERAQSPDIAKRPRSRSRSRSLSPGRHSKKCRQHSPSHSPLSKNIQCARHELKADMRMYLQANPKSKSVTRMLTGLVHYEAALAQIDSDPESAVEQLAQAFLTDDSAIHPVEHVASFKKAAHQRLQRAHADLPALLVLSQLQSPDTRLALYDRCLRALADPSNAAWKHWAARIFELRGLCHGRVGEFEDALCDYRLAVAAFGTTVWAPYSIGVCLNVLGRPVEGAESADSADSADSVDSAETAAAAECIAALQDFVAGAEEDAILLPDALYLLALLQLQERLGVPYLEPDCLQVCLLHPPGASLPQRGASPHHCRRCDRFCCGLNCVGVCLRVFVYVFVCLCV